MINVTADYTTDYEAYPYLGELNGVIVLFTERKTGVCLVHPEQPKRVGENHSLWKEHKFSVIEGTVTISNK